MKAVSRVLTNANIAPQVLGAEYACRGAIVTRANQLQRELKNTNNSLPFDKLVMCNIGNPQEMGAKALTYPRQILSACFNPELLKMGIYPSDVVQKADEILSDTPCYSVGAYSHSQGIPVCRQKVANFISERDNVESNYENIFLSDGASPAIKYVLQACIAGPQHGALLPLPQYPLYSATLSLLQGTQLSYALDEKSGWGLDLESCEAAILEGIKNGVAPRVFVIINPGNPTGNCLTEDTIKGALELAKKYNMVVFADEVYQTNVYDDRRPFHSFRKVLATMNIAEDVELISFHSISKGVFGECGIRGGYMELTNVNEEGKEQLYKMVSISLCPNTAGQVIAAVMCDLPKVGDASYESHTAEANAVYESLQRRANFLTENLNKVEGIDSQVVSGALYAFPTIELPQRAKEVALSKGMQPDFMYSMDLLEEKGICVVPGSGFGQEDGKYHFRTTILPAEEIMPYVCESIEDFHYSFCKKYQ